MAVDATGCADDVLCLDTHELLRCPNCMDKLKLWTPSAAGFVCSGDCRGAKIVEIEEDSIM